MNIQNVFYLRKAQDVLFDLNKKFYQNLNTNPQLGRARSSHLLYISIITLSLLVVLMVNKTDLIPLLFSSNFKATLLTIAKYLIPTIVILVSFKILIKKYYTNYKLKLKTRAYQQQLPQLMERLIMTIESGHDISSGIRIIVENSNEVTKETQIISEIERLISLIDQGSNFNEALTEVADSCPVAEVSHAFIHIKIAYEQGGELIKPLRELSDATHQQYQDTIEEEIAKLPVKATIPLLLIFAGLILLFVTPPVLEVLEITNSSNVNFNK